MNSQRILRGGCPALTLNGLTGSGCGSVGVTARGVFTQSRILFPVYYWVWGGGWGNALEGYSPSGRGGERKAGLQRGVGFSPPETISKVWSPHSESIPHLRSVDSGARAATGAPISSAAQQPNSRASCTNSITAPGQPLPAPSSSVAPASDVTGAPAVTPWVARQTGAPRLLSAVEDLRVSVSSRVVPLSEDERGVEKR